MELVLALDIRELDTSILRLLNEVDNIWVKEIPCSTDHDQLDTIADQSFLQVSSHGVHSRIREDVSRYLDRTWI